MFNQGDHLFTEDMETLKDYEKLTREQLIGKIEYWKGRHKRLTEYHQSFRRTQREEN